MIEWIQNHETIILLLIVSSVITFVLSLILIPILVVRIPPDYFTHSKRHKMPWAEYHPVIRVILLILKNSLGIILATAGVVMLVLPGQGLFTILVGITLLNFPGKYRLERWIVSHSPILRSINWLRQRAGVTPLITKQ